MIRQHSINFTAWGLLTASLMSLFWPSEPVIADTETEVSKFAVEGYQVTGPNPLPEDQTESIVSPFTGPAMTLEDLRQATSVLEAAIRDDGYAFYRVILPAQTLDQGVVTLKVLAFPIVEVEISDNRFHSDENVLRSLPGLKVGESPRTVTLQRSLAIANLNPSKQTQVFFSVEQDTGLVADITLKDQKTQNGLIWLNDVGSEETGDYRAGFAYQNSNLFDRDHILNASYSTSPEQTEDVQQYAVSYQLPFYRAGGLMNLYAIRSDVDSGNIATFFDVAGRGDFLGADFTYVLPNRGIYKHSLVAGLDDKLFDNDIDFQGEPIGIDVRSRPFSLRHRGNWEKEGLSGDSYASYSVNIESGSDNDDISYALTRAGATPEWSAFRFGGALKYGVGRWTFVNRLDAQFTDDALIPGEQFGVGGPGSLRGIDPRQLTGDNGVFLSGEFITPQLSQKAPKLLMFIEGAWLDNNDTLPGEIRNDTVASCGLGLRWSWNRRIVFSIDYGYLIDGSASQEAADVREGDGRFHFQILGRI